MKSDKNKEYVNKKDWGENCFTKSGENDLESNNLRKDQLYFFYAYPMDSFVKGVGVSIEDAEEKAWIKYQKMINCKEHEFEVAYTGQRVGKCKHCNYMLLNCFKPEKKCVVCGENHAILEYGVYTDKQKELDNYCIKHFIEKTKDFEYIMSAEREKNIKEKIRDEMKEKDNEKIIESRILTDMMGFNLIYEEALFMRESLYFFDKLKLYKNEILFKEDFVLIDHLNKLKDEKYVNSKTKVKNKIVEALNKNDKNITFIKMLKLNKYLYEAYIGQFRVDLIQEYALNEKEIESLLEKLNLPYLNENMFDVWLSKEVEKFISTYVD